MSAQQSHFFAGNTRGFRGGYASSRHSLSVAPIAGRGAQHAARRLVQLDARRRTSSPRPRPSGAMPPSARCRACIRARSRPAKCRCCSSRRWPPACSARTCRPPAAARCTASRASWSTASASACCAEHIDIHEDPHMPQRQGQRAVRRRRRRDDARATSSSAGVVQGYFLSSYSARKLGMRTTGHAGGSQNLTLTSRLTAARRRPRRDAAQAASRPVRHRADGARRQLRDRRLLARRRRLLGRERRIAHPVHEITIAGNLRDDVEGHRRGRRRRLHDRQQDDRLGADRAHEDRRRCRRICRARLRACLVVLRRGKSR